VLVGGLAFGDDGEGGVGGWGLAFQLEKGKWRKGSARSARLPHGAGRSSRTNHHSVLK
jgi:hypothetical protein